MNSEEIKKLIAKALLKEISESEQEQLDGWLEMSEQNSVFFDSLHSEEFLKKAIGDRNKTLRNEMWKWLEKETVGKRLRQARLRMLRIAAAIVLPLVIGCFAWYYIMTVVDGGEELLLSGQNIKVGGSKALVTLATGQTFHLSGDSTMQLANGLSVMTNQKDTLSITNSVGKGDEGDEVTVIWIPKGGEYIVRLEDGTIVHLNSESELRIPVCFGPGERKVWLKGEGYFNVRHDAKRKFIVKTDKADITVLGTEFGVRVYGDESRLLATLVRGSVEVRNEDDMYRIVPGEQARVNEDGKITVAAVNVEEYIAWTMGRIIFIDARLDDIMKELQRWYDFDFSYVDPKMKDLRFTMDIIKYNEVSDIFELMEEIGKVSFVVKGNNILLK